LVSPSFEAPTIMPRYCESGGSCSRQRSCSLDDKSPGADVETNSWWSGPGCLTVTIRLSGTKTTFRRTRFRCSRLGGAHDAAAELSGDARIALKWAQRRRLDGRKLAGLLCERVMKADLVGVGLNVNVDPRKAPAALRTQITSFTRNRGRAMDMTDALIAVAGTCLAPCPGAANGCSPRRLQRYDEHHALVGRKVSVVEAGSGKLISGRCAGLDSSGG
jgi:biotin-(acetyl-CoA carboxylase) ligase